MREGRVSAALRHEVVERAGGVCEYYRSQRKFATETFDTEHIIPTARKGTDSLDNLALACSGCNSHKSSRIAAKDPESGEKVPFYHPRQQIWREHFAWNADFTRIIGLTPTGRATVEALQMNREGLVNLCMVLYAMGFHPPQDPIR